MAELPASERIIALLRDEPMTGSQLRGVLGISKKSKIAFKQQLAGLVEQGLLGRNGKKQYLPVDPEARKDEKLPPQDVRPAARSRKQHDEAENRAHIHRGVLLKRDDEWFVTDRDSGKEHRVASRKQGPGKEGQTVSFTLYPHPKLKHEMLAKVDTNLIDYGTWADLTKKFMQEANLPEKFGARIDKEVAAMQPPSDQNLNGRVDLRDLRIVCIDPQGARDHDDAISVERTEDGFNLGVHIADVSFYVAEGSELDYEAMERSYTQYLPWCAVPMLPERLSGDLCSLHEGVDRYAFSCLMKLNKKAEVQSFEFIRTLIRVTKDLTYERAMELYAEKDADIVALADVARLLKKCRSANGLLELGSTEFKCEFNNAGEPERIVPRNSVESNSWIEECMLIANQCCAKELVSRKLQGIYRIHEAPDTQDIMELAYLLPDLFKDSPVKLAELGRPRRGDSNLNPTVFKLYQHLVERAKGDEAGLNRILRSMQKAHYDSNSFGHFALNWQDYSHFTSPIRRYADLWCHRELARDAKTAKQERKANIVEVCDLISANEIKNQKMERIAIKVCGSWMLREMVGETFVGTINGIEEWGIFVSIPEPRAEGLVRYRDLPGDDFFIFNADKGVVFGRRSGLSFRRGDNVEVQLLKVNPLRGENDFAILRKITPEKEDRAAATGRRNAKGQSRSDVAELMGIHDSDTFSWENRGAPERGPARGRGRTGRAEKDSDAPQIAKGRSGAAKSAGGTAKGKSTGGFDWKGGVKAGVKSKVKGRK
jgi:ribonuclease R